MTGQNATDDSTNEKNDRYNCEKRRIEKKPLRLETS